MEMPTDWEIEISLGKESLNPNTAIRGGTVGAARAVVRHGGSQRLR
jgi:hypothetical protein